MPMMSINYIAKSLSLEPAVLICGYPSNPPSLRL